MNHAMSNVHLLSIFSFYLLNCSKLILMKSHCWLMAMCIVHHLKIMIRCWADRQIISQWFPPSLHPQWSQEGQGQQNIVLISLLQMYLPSMIKHTSTNICWLSSSISSHKPRFEYIANKMLWTLINSDPWCPDDDEGSRVRRKHGGTERGGVIFSGTNHEKFPDCVKSNVTYVSDVSVPTRIMITHKNKNISGEAHYVFCDQNYIFNVD